MGGIPSREEIDANFAQYGLRVVAGPGPLRDVLPEGISNLAGRDDSRACVDCYLELHEQFDRFPETYCQHRRPHSDERWPGEMEVS
jgi:hypothetical protein